MSFRVSRNSALRSFSDICVFTDELGFSFGNTSPWVKFLSAVANASVRQTTTAEVVPAYRVRYPRIRRYSRRRGGLPRFPHASVLRHIDVAKQLRTAARPRRARPG